MNLEKCRCAVLKTLYSVSKSLQAERSVLMNKMCYTLASTSRVGDNATTFPEDLRLAQFGPPDGQPRIRERLFRRPRLAQRPRRVCRRVRSVRLRRGPGKKLTEKIMEYLPDFPFWFLVMTKIPSHVQL